MGEEGKQRDGGQDSTVGERGGDYEGRCDPGAIEEEDINGLVLFLTSTCLGLNPCVKDVQDYIKVKLP